MCRLFGLHTGSVESTATFWLVEAPDSLLEQSTWNRDGFGIGTFDDDGSPRIEKEPLPARGNASFAEDSHQLRGTTFVAHVRHATRGALTQRNTHPFQQAGRLFAHNGDIGGLHDVDARLAKLGASALVLGDTDSERIFALITAETRRRGGHLDEGIVAALAWLRDNVPITSLNFVLTTPTDLWAFRYPVTDSLYLLERPGGGFGPGSTPLDGHGAHLGAHSDELATSPSVVVASEKMDHEQGWRPIKSGHLVHVDPTLRVTDAAIAND
jgi:predicted glutamine amidotransferase